MAPIRVGGRRLLQCWSCLAAMAVLATMAGCSVAPAPDTFYRTVHDAAAVPPSRNDAGIVFELLPTMRNRRAAPSSNATLPVSSPAPAAVSEAVPTVKPDPALLGVNGAGQRKDPPLLGSAAAAAPAATTVKPTLVSEPINSDDGTQQLFDMVDVPSNEEGLLALAKAKNLTVTERDFQFYNSIMYTNPEESAATFETIKNITRHSLLSQSHRRAITIELTFDFPFYGHLIRNITVATGGFLYTGDYVHSWLAATQYIAPLMANFDSSMSMESHVRFQDNGTAFVVLWDHIPLQDVNITGPFTFSVTLLNTGHITFNYYTVPIDVSKIREDNHPVKIGLSDAYIIDKQILLARRKTIYEYHRVNFDSTEIGNSTIVRISPNPTCPTLKDCVSCTESLISAFACAWCPKTNKCSTGTDRKRQEWLSMGCDKTQIKVAAQCPAQGTPGNQYGNEQTFNVSQPTATTQSPTVAQPTSRTNGSQLPDVAASAAAGGIHAEEPTHEMPDEDVSGFMMFVSFFLPIGLVLTLCMWLFYAYRNPHTKSGQLLIQYRPTQWSWRRSEARYTAATIHM